MEEGSHAGLILAIVIGLVILTACGVLAALLFFMPLLVF